MIRRTPPSLVLATLGLCGLQLSAVSASPAQSAAHLQPAVSPQDAELREVRGTRVLVRLPPGFSPATSFAGFQDPERGLALMVSELSAPFEVVSAGFEDGGTLEGQGMKVLRRRTHRNGRYPGLLLEVEQRTKAGDFYKWIWLFGSQEECVIVLGACALDQGETHTDLLKALVLSSAWDAERTVDRDSALVFELGDTGGMERVEVVSGALGYMPPRGPFGGKDRRALFLCAPGMTAVPTDREAYARARIQQTATFSNIEIESIEPVEVDGLQGYATLATALDENDGGRSFIYQVLLSEGMTYWVLSGMGPQPERAELLPLYRKTASSFRRKREKIASKDGLFEVSVPASWTLQAGLDEDASLQVGAPVPAVYLVASSEAKADLERGLSLREYSAARREGLEQQALSVREPVELQLDGRRALLAEFDLPLEEMQLHYLHVSVDGREHFHNLLFWCPRETYSFSRVDITNVLGSLREIRDE